MTTKTDHWHRDSGWPCPCHGYSFNSVEQLQIHVSAHERERQETANWEDRLTRKEPQLTLDVMAVVR